MINNRNLDDPTAPSSPLIVYNIVITDDHYFGEFKELSLDGYSLDEKQRISSQAQRLYEQIEYYVLFASKEHRKNNCKPDSNQLDDSKLNTITRLITSEFFFYTHTPLTLREFQLVQNKVNKLAQEQLINLHLALGSFAVRTPNDEIMNVVVYVECGPHPKFHFLVKNRIAEHDPIYKENDSGDINVLETINHEDDISNYYINIGSTRHYFTFDTVFLSHSAAGVPFYNCADICVDHAHGSAKKYFDKKILDSINVAEEKRELELFPIYSSHFIISKSINKIAKYCLSSGS